MDRNFTEMMLKDYTDQKPANKIKPIFNVGDKIQYSKGCGTIMTIEKIENDEYVFANNMGHTTIEWGNKWYLVNPVEQNLAWSEEDEKRLQSCLNILQAKDIMGATETINTKWLKSLKERIKGE